MVRTEQAEAQAEVLMSELEATKQKVFSEPSTPMTPTPSLI